MNLTPVKEALNIILNNAVSFKIEEVNFLDAPGRVLKENIAADRDFPPFNRVSMDGIALSSDAFINGRHKFKIEAVQAAGGEQLYLKNDCNCIEVMTGAILPENTDIVIQYELIKINNGIAEIDLNEIKKYQNVHLKGSDKQKGDVLIKKNTLISAAEIGVLATVGKSTVKVAKQPSVIIISTGNELVDIDEIPEKHQIRRSNAYSLVSLLQKLNIKAETVHISDDKNLISKKIELLLKEFDVLLFSGAVSKGKFDFIPEVLRELGVIKLFHGVKQRPGKPFWFGRKKERIVFAFPGNPVSTFASCLKYFYAWYFKSIGINIKIQKKAILAEDFYFKPDLTYFLQVKLDQIEGKIYALPIKGGGSADLANLAETDAFLELPDDRSHFKKGEIFPVLPYRQFYT
jgi:molybdopterin molybdotransferase